jgi:hypothetical protein
MLAAEWRGYGLRAVPDAADPARRLTAFPPHERGT